jgi:hypothetical protein
MWSEFSFFVKSLYKIGELKKKRKIFLYLSLSSLNLF